MLQCGSPTFGSSVDRQINGHFLVSVVLASFLIMASYLGGNLKVSVIEYIYSYFSVSDTLVLTGNLLALFFCCCAVTRLRDRTLFLKGKGQIKQSCLGFCFITHAKTSKGR